MICLSRLVACLSDTVLLTQNLDGAIISRTLITFGSMNPAGGKTKSTLYVVIPDQ